MNNPVKLVLVKDIVDKQYRKGRFNRMDMVMRLLCLDAYFREGMKAKEWKWYRRMQHVRITKIRHIRPDKFPIGFERKRVLQFRAVINSFKEKGYDPTVKGIRLDKDMELVNGSHRLACCIYFGIEKIPVQWPPNSTKARRGYSLKWFHRHGFPLKLIKRLEERKVNMLKGLGLKDRSKGDYFKKICGAHK